MDEDRNPLWQLPPAQRYQVMVTLSQMWTSVWLWADELMFVHALSALGTLLTGETFRTVSRMQTYRDHPRSDGTARYDDVWGG